MRYQVARGAPDLAGHSDTQRVVGVDPLADSCWPIQVMYLTVVDTENLAPAR